MKAEQTSHLIQNKSQSKHASVTNALTWALRTFMHGLSSCAQHPSGPLGVVLAVSGGPDSLALLHAMHTIMDAWDIEVRAITFDHGLRADAQKEAQFVASICKDMNIAHTTLQWHGKKPVQRIQRSARNARYTALLNACAFHKASVLITAHHQDDQMETFLLRLLKGSGVSGLSSIQSKIPLSTDDYGRAHTVTLLRPFLSLSKNQLIDFLHHHHQPFFNDPSNCDTVYTRVRMRQRIEKMDLAPVEKEGWSKSIDHIQAANAFIERTLQTQCHTLLSPAIDLSAPVLSYAPNLSDKVKQYREKPTYKLDMHRLRGLDPFIQHAYIRRLVWRLSQSLYPPKFEKITHLLQALHSKQSSTLGGYSWSVQEDICFLVQEQRRRS